MQNIKFVKWNALNEIYGSKCIEQNEMKNMKSKWNACNTKKALSTLQFIAKWIP